jgi:hypothetical protein
MSVRLAAAVVVLAACTTTSSSDDLPHPAGGGADPSLDSSGTDTAPPAAAPHGGGRGDSSTDAGARTDASAKTDAGAGPGAPVDPYDAARDACVAAVNHYRALAGVAPLARHRAKEGCADAQATADAAHGVAHYAYTHNAPSCLEDNVIDRQNECPAWFGPPAKTATNCIATMYAEGPGPGAAHGHYTTMTNAQLTRLSCGFSVVPGGPPGADTWLVLDFY